MTLRISISDVMGLQWVGANATHSSDILIKPYASKISSHLGHLARPLYAIGTRIAAAHFGQ